MTHEKRSNLWPIKTSPHKTPQSTAIVSVNYNTKELITQLIWSIYKNLGSGGFAKLVVVDNHSTDGSLEILRSLKAAGLIELIENGENIYHGPALNQVFDFLASAQKDTPRQEVNAVWVIDSDCVVLRPDTLEDSTRIMTASNAAIVGQPVHDKWNNGTLGLHSLLIDPWQVWQNPITSFEEHGEPSKHLQESCLAHGLILTPFGFTRDKYIIHLGRGTLAEIKKNEDENNRYFEWAKGHSDPHYAGEEGVAKIYSELRASFYEEVTNFEPATIVSAIKAHTQTHS